MKFHLEKEVQNYSEWTSWIMSFSVDAVALILTYYYQDITNQLKTVNTWVVDMVDNHTAIQKFANAQRAAALPPMIVYIVLDRLYPVFDSTVYGPGAKVRCTILFLQPQWNQ